MNSAKTAVLILHYGNENLTDNCLSSVLQVRDSEAFDQVFIIDNSEKQDFDPKDVQTDSPVEVLRTGYNLGFAGGMNHGIRECLKKDYAFLFLLNNDTIVGEGCLTRLKEFLIMEKSAGIAAPLILYRDKPQKIWSTGSRISLNRGLTQDPYHNRTQAARPESRKVETVTGCAMMVKAEVFAKVGLFDESFFAYFEDVDFCYRTALFGYEIHFISKASVSHHVSAASEGAGKIRLSPNYFMIRNRIAFMHKYFGRSRLVVFYAFLLVETALVLAKNIFRLKAKKTAAFLVGLKDGFFPSLSDNRTAPEGEISACIITKDCERTIERCLQSLFGVVREIIILDSGSRDRTLSLCRKYTTQIYTTVFAGDFSALRNQVAAYAENDWILAIDSDEYLSNNLRRNLGRLTATTAVWAYSLKRENYYGQKVIRFGFAGFDSQIRLYRRNGSFFHGKVHERLISQGPVKKTKFKILHKPWENNFTGRSFKRKWVSYAAIEASSQTRPRRLGIIRHAALPLVFFLTFFKESVLLLGLLDGVKGVRIAYFRALYDCYVFRSVHSGKQK